ncbi:hypothetical protein K469DRAFT_729519 [Zopfia rhizophila CBS 207.26]|uniref:Phosphoglycerate mutase-like protein n=1 Tax=Zopfia rhizophila CBS 207.26 TaxID=1314779 RepID=A0A6A6DPX2_9PEZI|nr:hypothetical protein K469DRAFT_729519 [Zopfia rhizophila CBS 207.26]
MQKALKLSIFFIIIVVRSAKWHCTAPRSYFSHDNDLADWSFRATTQPHVPYEVFYIARHGGGVHNVKEAAVGRVECENHWTRLDGNNELVWADTPLTSQGEEEALEAARFWRNPAEKDEIPTPESLYSSPLQRCLRTLDLKFSSLLISLSLPFTSIIKELVCERNGVRTCDWRTSKSHIQTHYPGFLIEASFSENDELWNLNARELLSDIFKNDVSGFVSLTSHSGAILGLLRATGYVEVPIKAGADVSVIA